MFVHSQQRNDALVKMVPTQNLNLLSLYLLAMEGSNRPDMYSLGVIAYEMLTGHLRYGDRLTRDLNWRTPNWIKYNSAIV